MYKNVRDLFRWYFFCLRLNQRQI